MFKKIFYLISGFSILIICFFGSKIINIVKPASSSASTDKIALNNDSSSIRVVADLNSKLLKEAADAGDENVEYAILGC
jgi:hypothetical protein